MTDAQLITAQHVSIQTPRGAATPSDALIEDDDALILIDDDPETQAVNLAALLKRLAAARSTR